MNEYFECDLLGNIFTENPFDFSKHSFVGIGGCAAKAYYPKSVSEMQALISFLKSRKKEYCVIGNLSNTLVGDGKIDKAVICTKKMTAMKAGELLYAESGVSSKAFLNFCRKTERTGAEFLAGIPCTMGGALFMNAGVRNKYISEIVESVLVLRDGQEIRLSLQECAYSYKNSLFMQNSDIILGAYFRLEKGELVEIDGKINEYLLLRAHLPKGKSLGCVFKNPSEGSAGEFIERAGLKGSRIGGAYVSMEHANFIINDGAATADDYKRLIELVQERVQERFGVRLEKEIRYLT